MGLCKLHNCCFTYSSKVNVSLKVVFLFYSLMGLTVYNPLVNSINLVSDKKSTNSTLKGTVHLILSYSSFKERYCLIHNVTLHYLFVQLEAIGKLWSFLISNGQQLHITPIEKQKKEVIKC